MILSPAETLAAMRKAGALVQLEAGGRLHATTQPGADLSPVLVQLFAMHCDEIADLIRAEYAEAIAAARLIDSKRLH